ncbi:MAG: DUF2235 domain-containing protein [Alphaproteobacteria bacterium]|jgi:hypothetical protein|nr:DUF2235 domain-containing protein [Alphaproteobacteria bacterium]
MSEQDQAAAEPVPEAALTASPRRNIVLCSDGTGNAGGKRVGTNVWRLYQAVDLSGGDQIAFHDDGVGSQDFKLFKALGGAFGWGLSRNIRELYTSLVRTYNPGDQIFLFGFSRGAFTVRSLAGLIDAYGVLERRNFPTPKDLEETVACLFKSYRRKEQNAVETAKAAAVEAGNEFHTAEITFLGVWDTVDAVGVPMDWLRDVLRSWLPVRTHRHDLNKSICRAYHALAVDDERRTFSPVMLDETKLAEGGEVEQVWFAGVHSNVGGGYPKDGMARVSLDWMMAKAEALTVPLRFAADQRAGYGREANVYDRLYDSRAGVAAYYRVGARDIAALCASASAPVRIHESVFRRIRSRTGGYAPINIPGDYHVIATSSDYPPVQGREPERLRMTRLAFALGHWRRGLYRALLGLTVVLALVVIALGVVPVEPLKGFGWVGGVAGFLLPDLAASFLGPLLSQPDGLAVFVGLFGALFWLRGLLKVASRDVASIGWRLAFLRRQTPEANALEALIKQLGEAPGRAIRWSLGRVGRRRWLLLFGFLVVFAVGLGSCLYRFMN